MYKSDIEIAQSVKMLPIGEIAEKLRFSDQFHFSHLFKKVYGMSPLSFRKAGRERNRQLYRS